MFRVCGAVLHRVAVLGASGGVGQPLAMLLKGSPLVTDLRLYDLTAAKGVAEDLAHMPTAGRVSGFNPGQIEEALDGARVVIISAGVPRKPGMSRDDLFNTNALVINELVTEVAKTCPDAVVGIVTNPLNSMVAVAAAAMEKAGCYNPKKLFGLLSLDVARATTFLAEISGHNAYDVGVPCIGGHSGSTLVPLFSQTGVELTQDQAEYLTYRVRTAGDTVVKLRQGRGSSALSIGYAAGAWVERVLRAMDGERGIVDYNLVESPLEAPKCRFFGSPHELGPEGVEKVLPLPKLNEYEAKLLDRCVPDLEKNLRKGFEYHARRERMCAMWPVAHSTEELIRAKVRLLHPRVPMHASGAAHG